MSEIRNLGWIRNHVCKVLAIDPTNVDSAFQGTADDPWDTIDTCINEAVEEELAELQVDSDYDRLLEAYDFSWPGTQRTLVLPDVLLGADIIRIEDWTHTMPGTAIAIYSRQLNPDPLLVSFLDRRTLQWGSSGPGEDKILKAFYIAEPAEMHDPGDEPRHIPSKSRWVVVWGAAILARLKQGESFPADWNTQRSLWRERMHLIFSKGRPRNTNAPQPLLAVSDGGFIV